VSDLRFTWDPKKALMNRRKHGVDFEEAESVFADEMALLLHDPDHSQAEDRFLLLGLSQRLRILVVAHAVRAGGNELRLISARKATKAERRQYVDRMKR